MNHAKLGPVFGMGLTIVVALAGLLSPSRSSLLGATGVTNPVPLINQPLVPDAVAPGGAGFTLTVNGTGFVSGSVVNWNGSARATQFISSSQLTATILATDIAAAGTASVTVTNPGPGGGVSNVDFFAVTTATPALTFTTSAFATGQGPFALVTADFNGDGKLDLAVANSDNTVSILLGNGDGTFQTHVDYPANPGTIVAGDFNHDGKLDLVVGNSILIGNGDGTFQPFVTLPISASVAADFNGDGNLDLAALVVDNTGAGFISVALGNGDGTFGTPKNSPTSISPAQQFAPGALSMSAGDFNGDGMLDVAVTWVSADGGTFGLLSVQLGNGDGTFQAGTLVDTSGLGMFNPTWVGFGDFNGDGKLDLAMTSCFTRDILTVSYPVFLGAGDGTFTAAAGGTPPFGNFACPASGAIGDFNGDGRLDLAAVNPQASGAPFPGPDDNTVSILLGNGDGSLQAPVEFPTGSAPFSVTTGDFNGDGKLDLAAANLLDNTVSVLLQQPPNIILSPLSLTFGSTIVGSTSPAQSVSVTNSSAAPLDITGVSISGDFAETTTCGGSLAPGASCAVSVTFTPTADITQTGDVAVSYNGTGSPRFVSLTGTGASNLVVSPTALDFGNHEVGTNFGAQTVTLTNIGNFALAISGITASVFFTETNTCGLSLAAGASCAIAVSFTPSVAGAASGTLAITDNASGSPQTVSLTGIGATTPAVFSLNFEATLDFGAVPTGTSATLPVTLSNASDQPLTVRRIIVAPRPQFTETDTCGTSVGPGATCTISVTFTPGFAGEARGILIAIDLAKPRPVRPVEIIRLTGEGTAGAPGALRTRPDLSPPPTRARRQSGVSRPSNSPANTDPYF